jgi:heme-degrading monooxygenase HmoA
MIARIWRATAAAGENADAYCSHFATEVAPRLKAIAGQRGALLLKREAGQQVEFIALTLWDSIETVKQFTGTDVEVAIVEPQARAVLTGFEAFVTHYEIASGFTLACDLGGSASSSE